MKNSSQTFDKTNSPVLFGKIICHRARLKLGREVRVLQLAQNRCEFLHGGLVAAMDGDEPAEVSEPDPLTFQERRSGLFGNHGLDRLSVAYSPSIRMTDFSEGLPDISASDGGLSSSYNVDAVVSAAWNSLKSEEYKLPWETGFWNQFLDPNVTVMEQMSKGFKRPMPVPVIEPSSSSAVDEVERRVVQKTFPLITSFLKNIKDIPERSWQEERETLCGKQVLDAGFL